MDDSTKKVVVGLVALVAIVLAVVMGIRSFSSGGNADTTGAKAEINQAVKKAEGEKAPDNSNVAAPTTGLPMPGGKGRK